MKFFTVHVSLILMELSSSALGDQVCPPIPFFANMKSEKGVASDWRAVSALPPQSGTAPISPNDSTTAIDSLEVQGLEVELEIAEEQASQTSFWWRILPEVRISASYGIGNLLFVDLSSMLPFVMPREDYRLTLSLSLNNIFNFSKHTQAVLQRDRLQLEYQRRVLVLAQSRALLQQELNVLTEEYQSLKTELSVLREVVHFNELRFEQGKIEYDALARSRLELINLQKNINRLNNQKSQILLRLQ